MATYAAFKHVELFNVGNTKKRVLKPPGGGSSDLFGSEQLSAAQIPRTMSKNRMQSNIFAAPSSSEAHKNVFRQGVHRYYLFGSETPRRAATGQDSHNRLFGEVDRPFTPSKNHMKSNLPIGGDQADGRKQQQNGKSNGVAHQNGNGTANGHHTNGHSNGNGNISSASSDNGSSHNGNPVTGEGYSKSNGAAEINTTVPSLNGGGHVINKNRIPPGGFSSGLW
ncbi:microtubule-associated protein Jupiter-like isoform X9 [Anopheles albimanus]|uniref:microtubule-associated protein Jupiter-like isoform X9 n=1 Tax=Anopheles albimanus TaxID=7167 RepID=UPI00163E7668|nr:microtubule-associated protein Jupiter-like isoform X9 [Anopheles albimanus]